MTGANSRSLFPFFRFFPFLSPRPLRCLVGRDSPDSSPPLDADTGETNSSLVIRASNSPPPSRCLARARGLESGTTAFSTHRVQNPPTMPYHSRKPVRMSLAAALEEERLELAGELEARNAASRRNQSATTTRSFQDAAPSPESPETLPPRHGSIAGIGVGVTPPVGRRNWHDPAPVAPSLRVNTAVAAAPPPATTTATATTAPATTATATTAPQPTSEPEKSFGQSAATTTTRRFSDNAALDKKKLADAQADSKTSHSAATSPVASKPKPSIRWDDSVVMSPSATSYSLNRRANRSADKSNKPPQSKNAMAAVMSGLDLKVGLPSFTRGRDSSRNNTQRGTSLDSRLSTSRLGRSSSPRNRWLGSSSRNSSTNPGKPAPEKSKLVESANAEKPQATPTPALAPAPTPAPVQSGETADADRKPSTSGDERLEKDMYDSENNPIETSDEEADDSSSSDDDSSTERGRKPSVDIILPARSNSSGSAKTGPPPLPVEEKESMYYFSLISLQEAIHHLEAHVLTGNH